jgi:hypothetical protein
MATVDALLVPKAFKVKDKEPEQLLIDFDAYMKTVKNFFIATAKDGAADRTKLAILQAIGGPDMVDLVEIVGKVQLEVVVADANNGVVGVAADTYQQAIEKIRQGIVARTNQAMSRLKLFQQMAQGEQQFSTWAQEVLKQAKRCTWQGYDEKWAARDAILYQTTDSKLRKKILAENLGFDDTVTWGMTNQQSGRKSKQLAEVTGAGENRIQRLEEQLCRLQAESPKQPKERCQTCTRSMHGPGRDCPAKKETCHKCHLTGHFRGAPVCKGEARASGEKGKKKKKKGEKEGKRLKEEDSSTDTSEAEGLGRIVEVVAAASDTSVSNTHRQSGDVKVHVSVRPSWHSLNLIRCTPLPL